MATARGQSGGERGMLLFIGGAPRTGKGILARRLLREKQMPCLSLDVLKMGLTRGAPRLGIDPDAGPVGVATQLWPIVREMSLNLLGEGVDYTIEGELLPALVSDFQREHPTRVKACFLGYATITPAQKLLEIRAHAGHPNDWSSAYTDSDLLELLQRMIEFSRWLQVECISQRAVYFDTSENFGLAHEQVMAFVSGQS